MKISPGWTIEHDVFNDEDVKNARKKMLDLILDRTSFYFYNKNAAKNQ